MKYVVVVIVVLLLTWIFQPIIPFINSLGKRNSKRKRRASPIEFENVWLDLLYNFRVPILFFLLNGLLIFLFFYTSKVEHGEVVYVNHAIAWLCGLIVIPSIIFIFIASDKNETDRATFHDSKGGEIGYLEWNTGRIIKGDAGCGAFVFMTYVIIYLVVSIYYWIWG